MVIDFFLVNRFLSFCITENECCSIFLLESTILRSRVQYIQHCTLLEQLHCRNLYVTDNTIYILY